MDRRRFLQTAMASGAMATGLRAYADEKFPSRPITMVVAYSPGGGTDTLTRALSKPLSKALGQSVVVENKPGASEIIASEYVVGAKPDGYTLLVCSVPHVTNPSLRKLPYGTVNDFSAVCLAAQSPFILVVKPDSPIKSLGDLVSLAKTRKLSFASSGIGTADHMSTELFCYMRAGGLRPSISRILVAIWIPVPDVLVPPGPGGTWQWDRAAMPGRSLTDWNIPRRPRA